MIEGGWKSGNLQSKLKTRTNVVKKGRKEIKGNGKLKRQKPKNQTRRGGRRREKKSTQDSKGTGIDVKLGNKNRQKNNP